MSFDIFFQFCDQGEPCSHPVSEVESEFQAAIMHREPTTRNGQCWRLEYPVLSRPEMPPFIEVNGKMIATDTIEVHDNAFVYITIDGGTEACPTTDSFMVNRPAAHLDFYAALLRLLQTSHSALFWPGNNSLVVGQLESIKHLPEGMAETLGEPFLVTEPQQIIDRIRAS